MRDQLSRSSLPPFLFSSLAYLALCSQSCWLFISSFASDRRLDRRLCVPCFVCMRVSISALVFWCLSASHLSCLVCLCVCASRPSLLSLCRAVARLGSCSHLSQCVLTLWSLAVYAALLLVLSRPLSSRRVFLCVGLVLYALPPVVCLLWCLGASCSGDCVAGVGSRVNEPLFRSVSSPARSHNIVSGSGRDCRRLSTVDNSIDVMRRLLSPLFGVVVRLLSSSSSSSLFSFLSLPSSLSSLSITSRAVLGPSSASGCHSCEWLRPSAVPYFLGG